jgi:cutinase
MSAQRIIGVLGVAVAMTSAVLSGPVGVPSAHADPPCPNVQVVFARGTGEPPGVGKVGQSFIDSLSSQIGGRSLAVYPVSYPATPAVAVSAQNGADDMSTYVQGMAARCPNTKMVLGGFSQGAAVVDLATTSMPPEVADHVAAVAVFGNPTSALASSLAGTTFPGIGPLYSAKATDVCATDDPACSPGLNPAAHGSYVQSGLTVQAATFVAGRL